MLLSIIIPVYNVEKYLVQCINSILNLDKDLIEIILIDDGSTDNSSKICDKYSNEFDNINVIHKKNSGLSAARNTGLHAAKGKYIIFLDSDDYILKDKLKEIINIISQKDIDVIMSNFYKDVNNNLYIGGENKVLKSKKIIKNNSKLVSDIFKYTKDLWPAWKFIVKKEFLIKNNIKFKEGFLHEDVDYTTRIIIKMKSYYYFNDPWYCYRLDRNGSIMNNKKFKSLLDTTDIIIDLKEYIEKNVNDIKVKNIILERLSETLFLNLKLYNKGSNIQKQDFLKKIKSNTYLLSKSKNKKHKIFFFSTKIFGTKFILEKYCYILNKK